MSSSSTSRTIWETISGAFSLLSAWIVGDQESDTFDLFGTAQQLGTHFPVRTRASPLADGGLETIIENAEARG